MNGHCAMAAWNRLALVLLLMAVVTPVSAETETERLSRLQAESEWVWEELKGLSIYEDDESRARLESEVERLEEERRKLLRIVPEQLDPPDLLADLSNRAAHWNVNLHSSAPYEIGHDGYGSLMVRLTLEGEPEDISRFIRVLQLSQGTKWVSRRESAGPGEQVDVTWFSIPARTVELRDCSIPESPAGALEREVALHQTLLSRCTRLDEADADLRRLVNRRRQLLDVINLATDLSLSEPPLEPAPEPPARERPVAADVTPNEEMPEEMAAILEEPPPAELFAILEEPPRERNVEERKKRAEVMADMRWIGMAVEAYAGDFDVYPPTTDMAELAETLGDYFPGDVGLLPLTDPWGMSYRWISDGQNYRIVSGGEDLQVERRNLAISDDIHPNDDFVYENATFRQAPRP